MKTAVPDNSQHVLGENARRNWARDILAISAELSANDVQSQMLGRLETFDFVPPPPVRQAIYFLSQSVGLEPKKEAKADWNEDRVDPFKDDIEGRLHDEIEDFARNYFEQPILERRRRWEELTARARPFPRLRMRLAPMLAGLDVASAIHQDDARAELLARRVAMLYVLPPAQQESVRQQWLREMRNSGPWKSDVRKFRARFSKLAWLEPDLLSTLEMMETTEPRREAAKTIIPGIVPKTKSHFTPTAARSNATNRSSMSVLAMIVFVMAAGRILAIFGHLVPEPSTTTKFPSTLDRYSDPQTPEYKSIQEILQGKRKPYQIPKRSDASEETTSANPDEPAADAPAAADTARTFVQPDLVPPTWEPARQDESQTASKDEKP